MRYRDRIRILGAGGGSVLLAACGGGGGGRDTSLIGNVPDATGAVITRLAGNGTAGFAGDGVAALSAQLGNGAITLDAVGNIFIADATNHRVRMIARVTATVFGRAVTAGNIYTIAGTGTAGAAGDGGPATAAQLNRPGGVAIDVDGNLIVADTGNSILRVVARVGGGTPYGIAMAAGEIEALTGAGGAGFAGDGGPAAFARFNEPRGLAVDPDGNILVADSLNNVVRVIIRTGGTRYGTVMAPNNIYRIAGDAGGAPGYAGDGALAVAGRLDRPWDVAVDANFNVAIAERNNSVVRLRAGGAGSAFGRLLSADFLYTLAGDGVVGTAGDGGPANAARLAEPLGVAFSTAGDLFIAESLGNRVRLVARATGSVYGAAVTLGNIYTIAGNGGVGYDGDGAVPAARAASTPIGPLPTSVALDTDGRLLISSGNRLLRVGP